MIIYPNHIYVVALSDLASFPGSHVGNLGMRLVYRTLGSKMSGLARVFSRCKKKLAIWSSVVNNLGIFDLSNHLAPRTISLSPEGLISWLYGLRHGWLIHVDNVQKCSIVT